MDDKVGNVPERKIQYKSQGKNKEIFVFLFILWSQTN